MTRNRRLIPLCALVLAVTSEGAYSDNALEQFNAYKNETVVCGVSWESGRWRDPVAVLFKEIGESRWVGWIDTHVYSVEAVELTVKSEKFGQIVLESDSENGVNFVVVLRDGEVEIRTRNFESDMEDSASGYCRQLGRGAFSVEVEEKPGVN